MNQEWNEAYRDLINSINSLDINSQITNSSFGLLIIKKKTHETIEADRVIRLDRVGSSIPTKS